MIEWKEQQYPWHTPLVDFSIGTDSPASPRIDELEATLVALARERLTAKQRQILAKLPSDQPVTRLVGELRRELDCSSSTVWNNLLGLRRARLVLCGSRENKGLPVTLTETGMLVQEGIAQRWRE